MLKLILGPSGTGKTGLLYQQIRARAAQGEKSILLVPEQFTSSTESRIYRTLGDAGSGMVDSLSFTSLAERVLSACGGAAVPTLGEAGRAVLVRRAMTQLADKISHYRRHRRSAAFCAMAAATISELKSAGLGPEQLAQLAPGCGSGREKLAELALIYGTYEALLAKTAMDPADRLTQAADRLEAALAAGQVPDFLQDRAIFIDEFDTFNAPKKRLMAALLAIAPQVTVALCADGRPAQEGDLSLFSGGRRVALTLKQLARKHNIPVEAPTVLTQDLRHKDAPGLAALGCWLADEAADPPAQPPEEIRLYPAASREEEARAVAAAIRHLARSGVRYNKMAVVCREASLYQAAVRYEFRLAGIPLFCDEDTTPEFSAPATAVKALLALVRGGDWCENMTTLAKTGLCGLTERQICALDNYVYTWSPKRAEWGEPFTRSPQGFGEGSRVTEEEKEDYALAEQARAKLIPPVEKLRRRTREADAPALSKALYLCLKELGAEESQAELAESLRQSHGIPAGQEAAREWNVVMQLLDQMAALLGSEPLDSSEYEDLFGLLLRTSNLGHIPQTLDAVIFTTAGKMRLDNPEYVFVLGLAEGEFPRAPGEVGLLTHADRDRLMAQNVDLPDCFENRAVREQICFYKALTAPGKGLWLSWPEGLALPLTSSLEPAARSFGLKAPILVPLDYAATPAAALDRLGSVWNTDPMEAASLRAALQAVPETAAVLQALQRSAEAAPRQITDTDTMARVLGDTMRISPSQMEKYYSCRYGYFLQYVLGLRPRQKAALTPNQSGSLMHWVLQMTLDPQDNPYADWKPAPFEEMTDAQCAQLADRLTDEYVRLYMPDTSKRFAYLIRRLKRSLAGMLCYLRDEQSQGLFRPAGCEVAIRRQEGCLPPQVYRLPDGRTVEVIGTVDRADTWVDTDGQKWVRVVDYKTGTKGFDLREVYCGLDCQMLLYLFTLTKAQDGRFVDAKPAGVLYLLADRSPKEAERDAPAPPACTLDGLVLDDAAVYHAMDEQETGLYLPFDFRNGAPNPYKKKHLADADKLARIETHLSGLVTDMADQLYAGRIEAEPLCANGRDSCRFCDFSLICRHEAGEQERGLDAPKNPFEEVPQPEAEAAAQTAGKDGEVNG